MSKSLLRAAILNAEKDPGTRLRLACSPSTSLYSEFILVGQACIITDMIDDWKAMKNWPFEWFQHDPRIADGVYIGQRLTPVPLSNYVKYLKEREPNETAPWVIFMSDVFDLYPKLRRVKYNHGNIN